MTTAPYSKTQNPTQKQKKTLPQKQRQQTPNPTQKQKKKQHQQKQHQ